MTDDAEPSLKDLINQQQGKPSEAPLAKGIIALSQQKRSTDSETASSETGNSV